MVDTGERSLPDLDRMVFLWLVLRLETDHLAGIKQSLAVANQWGVDGLPNQVIAKLDVGARFIVVKQIQIVFAVGRRDGALITHVAQPMVKPFALAGL